MTTKEEDQKAMGSSGSERGDVLRGMIPINIQEGSNENQC